MVQVVRWDSKKDGPPPSEQEAEARLSQDGYRSFCWHDVPGAFYPPHKHEHDECLWVLKGSIHFVISTDRYELFSGDRLFLPKGTSHTAEVPRTGSVTYLVGQKRN